MAKKGQAVQLQVEVNNDEDWEKLLQRDGLIIVDVYSDWCGPCSGMSANLKKIKLEIGGDLLHLAMAKSDGITVLERFRNKSEPTWMFIVDGKLVNFMFGANAPKLTRLILDELKKEKDVREGKRERVTAEIGDLTEEEQERNEVIENQAKEASEYETIKARKELHARRLAEANNILDNISHLGAILIFPHAKTRYIEAIGDLLNEAGLTISQTEKPFISRAQISELFYFREDGCVFEEEEVEELTTQQSIFLLIKPIPARSVTDPTDFLLLGVLYGEMMAPPGSPKSAAQFLSKYTETDEDGVETERHKIGCWTPETDLIKATTLRIFFPKTCDNYIIPEPEPTPPHYAVVFEAFRRREIETLMEKYEKQVLRYGYFTSEVPEEAQLIAKTTAKYEKDVANRGADEKLVLQLSQKSSECVLAFVQLKPAYISANPKEGKRECRLFFPDDYDVPDVEEPEPEPEEEDIEEGSIKGSVKGSIKGSVRGSVRGSVKGAKRTSLPKTDEAAKEVMEEVVEPEIAAETPEEAAETPEMGEFDPATLPDPPEEPPNP